MFKCLKAFLIGIITLYFLRSVKKADCRRSVFAKNWLSIKSQLIKYIFRTFQALQLIFILLFPKFHSFGEILEFLGQPKIFLPKFPKKWAFN